MEFCKRNCCERNRVVVCCDHNLLIMNAANTFTSLSYQSTYTLATN